MMSLLLVLSACGSGGKDASKADTKKGTEPVLWLVKTRGEDEYVGDLYVKYGKAEIEKIASDVVKGSQITSYDGNKVLFLDNEGQLYYAEKGKEKEKVGTDVSEWSYSFSSDGSMILYLTNDSGLYMKKAAEDRTKLASNVTEYQLDDNEESVYILDQESELSKITLEDEKETDVASDVISYTLTENGLIYTNEDSMLYKVNNEGEKEKLSKSEVVSPDISSDASVITYLEEYNFEKGYGELFIQTEKEEREKVASDIKDHNLSPDGSEIYYVTSDDILNVYNVDSKKKTKLGTDVADYQVEDSFTLYLTNEQTLYKKEGKNDPLKLSADVQEYGVLENGDVYFLTKDKDLYTQKKKDEKKKVLSDIENLYVSNGYIYYLSADKKIGYLQTGQEKPEVLIEELQEYSVIYAEEYLLYQNQLTLSDIQGYWFNAEYDFFLSFDEIDGEQAQMGFYDSTSENVITVTMDYATENALSVSNDDGGMEIKLVNPKTIEANLDGEYYTFTQSNENALAKMRERNATEETPMDDIGIEDEAYEEEESSSASANEIEDLVTNYTDLLVDAINYNDFSIVEPTLVPNSALYNMQKDLVKNLNEKGITEEMSYFEVLDITEGSLPGEYKVKTNEEVEIYAPDGTSEIQDYYWTYTVVYDGDTVGLTDIKETE